MTLKRIVRQSTVAITLLGTAIAATPASATGGYFSIGFGAVQRSMGGAGVAHTNDAMSSATNPAGVADVGKEFQLGLQLFNPVRGFEGTGTFFVPSANIESEKNFFLAPNFAYNVPLENGAVLNFAAYGNGGMNTTYPDFTNLNCQVGSGVFCGGPAGVDLIQLFLSATYAKKVGNVSFGIAPTVAIQGFSATGLAAFGAISVDGNLLTNNGQDWSYGYGLRAGIEIDLSDTLRFGLAGQTKMWMSEFEKYSGLFADGGDFDIPASVTAGLAYDANPNLTLMLDYQHIFYSDIGALANAGNAGPLGAAGGAGFGWDDVDVVKLGVEWRANDKITLRAGYAYATNPIGAEDVTLNILAPGITTHHFTAGGTFSINDRNAINFSAVYAPLSSVSGSEVTPQGATPGSIELKMYQASVNIEWSRTF